MYLSWSIPEKKFLSENFNGNLYLMLFGMEQARHKFFKILLKLFPQKFFEDFTRYARKISKGWGFTKKLMRVFSIKSSILKASHYPS